MATQGSFFPTGHAISEPYHPKPSRPRPKRTQRERRGSIHVVCLECSRTFYTNSTLPVCPGCGGSDVDLA